MKNIDEGKVKPSPKAPPKPDSFDKKSSLNEAAPKGTSAVKPSSVVLDDAPDSSLSQQATPGPQMKK